MVFLSIRRIVLLAAAGVLLACGDGGPVRPAGQPMAAAAVQVFDGPRANFTIARTAGGFAVTPAGGGAARTVDENASLRFADVSVSLPIAALASSVAEADLKILVELYVALFNRTPDAEGLAFWIGQFQGGRGVDAIADDFYSAAIQFAALTGYSTTMTNMDFVRVIYKNVLGRSGDTAPPQADVDYWAGELASGRATRGSLIKAMLASAHSFKGNATWGWVADLLDNKYSVGRYFAVEQGLTFLTSNDSITRGMAIAAAVSPGGIDAAMDLVGQTVPSTRTRYIAGPGVSGVTASDTLPSPWSGSSYNASPGTGFAAIETVVDGAIAASSGTLDTNRSHWVWSYGKPATGTQLDNVITVPADFTKIPYPSFYVNRQPTSYKVADPYCAIKADVVAYPAAWLGEFALPEAAGAPLPVSMRRGASVKDYWAFGLTNPSTNAGCGGDLHEAFTETIRRLKKLGADHVNVYRDTRASDFSAASMSIAPYVSFAISDTEMLWIVQQATAAGLQVFEFRQIDPQDDKGAYWPAKPTLAQVSALLDAYVPYIVDRAKFAQQAGVAAFQLDFGVLFWPDWDDATKSLFIQKMAAAAQQVKAVYSGKLIYGQTNPWLTGTSALLANVDWYYADLAASARITAEQDAALSVDVIRAKYAEVLGWYKDVSGGKPLVVTGVIQSHRHFYRDGWVEDGFCVNGCSQNGLTTDFSVQALGTQALFQAVKATTLPVASVDVVATWYVDVILPKSSFPNTSQSWRNKPAESIIYRWFQRP